MFLPTWNKDVLDRSIARALHKADPTRAVNPHSGVLPGIGSGGPTLTSTSAGTTAGWTAWPRRCAVPRLARFVTEFGAQAVPDTAGFMHPERWPDLDWDDLFEHHACQKRYFDQHVPPALFESFAAWRDATQHYQAALIQLQVEDLRRLKHDPTGGFCHFCFADGHPSVTWSVLDHDRVPKAGYAALRDACRTVLPMLEPRAGLVHVVSEGRDRSRAWSSRPTWTAGATGGPATSRPTGSPTSAASTCPPMRTTSPSRCAIRRSARCPTRTTTCSSGSVSCPAEVEG